MMYSDMFVRYTNYLQFSTCSSQSCIDSHIAVHFLFSIHLSKEVSTRLASMSSKHDNYIQLPVNAPLFIIEQLFGIAQQQLYQSILLPCYRIAF